MIYVHTGLPGAGKTLYTLHQVRQRAAKDQRPVFYAGIEILKPEEFPNWHHLDKPEEWFDLPDGAIIVHDECQTLYRPRGNGAAVPPHVAKLETHRHKGHDIYFITQHPMLIDSNVRRLAGEHCHIVRAFGAKFSTVHQWGQIKEQCDKSRGDSVSSQFRYPVELFEAYKSATVHTHKSKIPLRLWLALLVPVLLGFCVWYFTQWASKAGESKVEPMPTEAGQMSVSRPGGGRDSVRPKTTAEWIEEQRPRIKGLPHTAPVYDKVTAATIAPIPAACIATASRCLCYTQQGTRMDTDEPLCRQIADTGYFVAFDQDRRGPDRGRVSDTAPDRSAPQSSIEPRSVPMPL